MRPTAPPRRPAAQPCARKHAPSPPRAAPRPPPPPLPPLPQQTFALASASAVLGPCCDSLHSGAGVLTYAAAAHPVVVPGLGITTCPWVPCLFAVAGIILGVGTPVLDSAAGPNVPPPATGYDPGWPVALATIAAFVFIYWWSAQPAATAPALTAAAVSLWAVTDRTPQGAALALAAAIAGPAIETGLIQGLHLYSYSSTCALGPWPAWVPAVYAAGGPAVGLLGRRVAAELRGREK